MRLPGALPEVGRPSGQGHTDRVPVGSWSMTGPLLRGTADGGRGQVVHGGYNSQRDAVRPVTR